MSNNWTCYKHFKSVFIGNVSQIINKPLIPGPCQILNCDSMLSKTNNKITKPIFVVVVVVNMANIQIKMKHIFNLFKFNIVNSNQIF